MNVKTFLAVAVLGLVSSSAMSAELLVTAVPSGSQLSVGFDLVSDGNVAGINFKLNVPGLADSKAKLPKCVAELPAGFSGGCSVTKGGVYVYATSDSPSTFIPAGMAPIGKVVLNNPAAFAKAGGALNLTVSELAMYDNSAKAINVSSRIDVGSSARE